LSSTVEANINIPFITTDESGPKHLEMKLSRAKFEELTKEYVDRSIEKTKEVVKDAGFKVSDIDEIVLVGGQIRMPAIQEAVKELFGKEPHKGINPDEVVAMGAAVQAGIFQGDVKDVLLLDVTPLSLGLETLGGVFTKTIEKNTTIPASKSQVFSTAADNQPSVEINVLQGERPMAADNKTLGRFILDGIPPAPRGIPQVEVSFDIDANGILKVSAKDKATNKEQSIRIEASSGITDEEIEKMKQDAEVHKEEDQQKQEMIEVRNMAETLIYTSEKTLKDAGDKVKDEDKKEVEEKVKALKDIKEKDDKDAIKRATEDLSKVIQKVGAELYKEAPSTGSGQDPAAEGAQAAPEAEQKDDTSTGSAQAKAGDKEPIKGEYEEKDKDKDKKKD